MSQVKMRHQSFLDCILLIGANSIYLYLPKIYKITWWLIIKSTFTSANHFLYLYKFHFALLCKLSSIETWRYTLLHLEQNMLANSAWLLTLQIHSLKGLFNFIKIFMWNFVKMKFCVSYCPSYGCIDLSTTLFFHWFFCHISCFHISDFFFQISTVPFSKSRKM